MREPATAKLLIPSVVVNYLSSLICSTFTAWFKFWQFWTAYFSELKSYQIWGGDRAIIGALIATFGRGSDKLSNTYRR